MLVWYQFFTMYEYLVSEHRPLLSPLLRSCQSKGSLIRCSTCPQSVPYGLRAAAERGLSAVFHTLSCKNAPGHLGALDERGYSLLHHAAMCNQPHIIYQLAAAGVNLNQPCVGRFVCSGTSAHTQITRRSSKNTQQHF